MSRVTSRIASASARAQVIKRPRSIMATEASLVKSAIKTVVEENELQLSSLRRDNLKRGGKRILELIGGEVKTFYQLQY